MNAFSIVVSTSLANHIKSHTYSLPTNPVCGVPLVVASDSDCYKLSQSGWSSITVNEEICNSISRLTIPNNECLQYIYVQAESLEEIRSLSLSNLPELILIITENRSFHETRSLILSSIFYLKIN